MMFAVLTSVIVLAPQEPPSTGSVYQSPRAEVRLACRGEEAIVAGDGHDLIYLNGEIESVEARGGNDHVWALGLSPSLSGSPGPPAVRNRRVVPGPNNA
jgi:hypothetical protein